MAGTFRARLNQIARLDAGWGPDGDEPSIDPRAIETARLLARGRSPRSGMRLFPTRLLPRTFVRPIPRADRFASPTGRIN